MINRRKFLKSGALSTGAAAAAITSQATAASQQQRENASGVGGYDYRLPAFKQGSRLLFQGDSITDMKWGRNQNDRNHYLGHSYVYLIAARLGVDMPEAKLVRRNGTTGAGKSIGSATSSSASRKLTLPSTSKPKRSSTPPRAP